VALATRETREPVPGWNSARNIAFSRTIIFSGGCSDLLNPGSSRAVHVAAVIPVIVLKKVLRVIDG
jgi:hypothetical protein